MLAKSIYSLALLLSTKEEPAQPLKGISILVAARDEEEHLQITLDSLSHMQMNGLQWEVWIGDDQSTDKTAEIAKQYCETHPHFHYLRIEKNLEGLKAKQNVLAQLAKQTSFSNILICDADMQVHPLWARTLAGELEKDFGMVCGTTIVAGTTFFSRMQTLDWLMGMSIAKSHSVMGIPITGVGNNMAVTKEAYEGVGGYEKLPFSITEDYKLFQAIHEKAGWKYRQLFHESSLSFTVAAKDISQWLGQRRRWFRGGAEIAWYNKTLLLFNAIVMPILVCALFLLPLKSFLVFWSMKLIADFCFLLIASMKLNNLGWMKWFPLFEMYYQVVALVLPFNQILFSTVNWKGRKY